MLILEPFSTCLRDFLDFTNQDDIQEAQQLIQRQTAIQNCLLGKESPDLILDLLEFQGIDPLAYVEAIEANVNFVIANAVVLDDSELL